MVNYRSLKPKYTKVALGFLKRMKKKHKIICMFLTGSYYTEKLVRTSDLDVFLITDNSSKLREKGVIFFEGIKVSYFLNPYWKIIELLSYEKEKLKRPTSEIIYFSECLAGKKEAERLKKLAKKTLSSLTSKIDKKEVLYLGWKLYDKIEVFERKNYNQLNKEYLKFDLFNLSIDIFFFVKRSYKPHAKYTLDRIRVLDKLFYKKVKNFLGTKSDLSLISLVNYLFRLLEFNSTNYYKRTKDFN